MQPSHIKILEALKKRPLSKEELIEATGYSYDGIRGRISELRKFGYDIQLKEVPVTITVKKYVLVSNGTNKLIDYLDKHNLYGVHTITGLSRMIGESVENTKRLIARLFDNPNVKVVQIDSNRVSITRNHPS